jgi:hypothetical protein
MTVTFLLTELDFEPTLPCALLEILLQYPRAKFVIVNLGEKGCMMVERSEAG